MVLSSWASRSRFVRTSFSLKSLSFALVVIYRSMADVGSQYKRHSGGGFPVRKRELGAGFVSSQIHRRIPLSLQPALRTVDRGFE